MGFGVMQRRSAVVDVLCCCILQLRRNGTAGKNAGGQILIYRYGITSFELRARYPIGYYRSLRGCREEVCECEEDCDGQGKHDGEVLSARHLSAVGSGKPVNSIGEWKTV